MSDETPLATLIAAAEEYRDALLAVDAACNITQEEWDAMSARCAAADKELTKALAAAKAANA